MSKKQTDKDTGALKQDRTATFKAFHDKLLSSSESTEVLKQKEGQIDLEFENEELSLKIRKEKRTRRKYWNRVLIWLVVLGFFLSYLMIVLIGTGVLNFDDNAFAVPSVVAAGIVETYGLAKLAIKYFFSEDEVKTKPRKRSDD